MLRRPFAPHYRSNVTSVTFFFAREESLAALLPKDALERVEERRRKQVRVIAACCVRLTSTKGGLCVVRSHVASSENGAYACFLARCEWQIAS